MTGLGETTGTPHGTMSSLRVFDFGSDPHVDVLSLEMNRRVSAVLHGGEPPALLLLNGGSEVELLHVDVVVPAVREPLCFGSYAVDPGKYVIVELLRPTRSVRLRVRVMGGPQPIVLDERPNRVRSSVMRLAAAAAFVIGFGSLLLMPHAGHRYAAATLPPTSGAPAVAVRAAPKPAHPPAIQHHKAPPRLALAPKAPVHREPAAPVRVPVPVAKARRATEPPPVVAVSTPPRAFNGQTFAIAFRTNGRQVHIIAKIGPRTIADRIIGASRGSLFVSAPPSADVRVLTVYASAENDGGTASRGTMVILLPQIPPSPQTVTNL
jgi:hypothetical protein